MSGFAAPRRSMFLPRKSRFICKLGTAVKKLQLLNRNGTKLGLLVIDAGFFGLTDPSRAASGYFIIAFLLLSLSIFLVVDSLFKLTKWYGIELKHRARFVGAIGGGVCGLIALQSIGQLSSRDVVLLLPLGLLAYMYVSYAPRRFE